MSLLSVKQLSVQFTSGADKVAAVRDVSFTIEHGEFFALVGESGSGKSVTAFSILGLLPDSAHVIGQITFDGQALNGVSDTDWQKIRGKRISMIFQEPMTALNPLHSIGRQMKEIIQLHQSLSAADCQQKMTYLLAQVGLAHFATRLDAYPHQLSGGERQRVMIAMAMANDPELLIADEPTTALDVTLQAQILGLLKKLQKERGLSILMITHDLSIVRQLADRIGVMKDGRLVEAGAAATLLHTPKQDYTRNLLNALPSDTPAPIAADAAEIIRAENLSITYHKKRFLSCHEETNEAVKQLSLQLSAGESLGIVGESGSGKTSLGLALLKLIHSTGAIHFMGEPIHALNAKAMKMKRSQMQIVFQDPYGSLNPRMNVASIIGEGLAVHLPHLSAIERRRQVDEMVEAVGLSPAMGSRYPHEFSGGQRQRISIARAMILKPHFVVLDEPTSALDVTIQCQIIDLLREFQARYGMAYLFISHDLRVVRAMCHRIMVMHRGALVEQGTSEQIFTAPAQPYTKQLIAAAMLEPQSLHASV